MLLLFWTNMLIFFAVIAGWRAIGHCKDKMPKIWNKYSQKRNIGVSVPISTFMCLWANYIFPRLVCLFCWRKYVDQSWEYINRSHTHECGNWGWGRAIPRKEIYKNGIPVSVGSKVWEVLLLSDTGPRLPLAGRICKLYARGKMTMQHITNFFK